MRSRSSRLPPGGAGSSRVRAVACRSTRACARSRAFGWLIRRFCCPHAASRPRCGADRGEGAYATHRPLRSTRQPAPPTMARPNESSDCARQQPAVCCRRPRIKARSPGRRRAGAIPGPATAQRHRHPARSPRTAARDPDHGPPGASCGPAVRPHPWPRQPRLQGRVSAGQDPPSASDRSRLATQRCIARRQESLVISDRQRR